MFSNHSPENAPPPSVCVVVPTLALPGGSERVAVVLSEAWSRAGTRVTIVTTDTSDHPPFFEVPAGVEVRNLALDGYSRNLFDSIVQNLRRIVVMRRAVRQVAPSAVISFIDVLNVTVVFACWGTGVPVIAAERTAPARAPIGRLWTFLRNVAYRMADHVVVQSAGAHDHFAGKIGTPLTIIPNPVPATRQTQHRAGGSHVVAIGRFTAEKGFDLLIRSFAVAARQFPAWTLTIYGDGPLRPQLESLVAAEGLGGRVSLPGVTSDSSGALAGSDIFVLSSHFEGFPNALCEAMAAGVACIATDCPDGPRDIVHDGADGLLIPPGDRNAMAQALTHLMASPDERQRLGADARRSVARFSIDRIIAEWNAVIAGVRRHRGAQQ